MPPNYLVWAIVATLCSLIGIVAIIFAAQVETKYRAGDYAGSKNASDKAKLWVVISFVVSVFFLIIIIAAAASSSSSST